MMWYQDDDEEEDLMFSPALMARRASESWIDTPPVEVSSPTHPPIPPPIYYSRLSVFTFVLLQVLATQTSLQRKKSLPDVQDLPRSTRQMPREEVSYLGSARREEVRRQVDERERLRANPLLYLVSPQVKVGCSKLLTTIIIIILAHLPSF